jgi:hypothetical protein
MELIKWKESETTKCKRNRSKIRRQQSSIGNVGMVLDKTIISVTTNQVKMCDNRRRFQL